MYIYIYENEMSIENVQKVYLYELYIINNFK